MIASYHSELDGTAGLGVGAALAARTLRLRRDGHRTGPPAAIIGRETAGSLDAVMATFESSRLPNPLRAECATEGNEATTNVTERPTLRGGQWTGLSTKPVCQARHAKRVIVTTARMQRGQPGARQIAEAVPTLRLKLIAASIRAEAAAKPIGEHE